MTRRFAASSGAPSRWSPAVPALPPQCADAGGTGSTLCPSKTACACAVELSGDAAVASPVRHLVAPRPDAPSPAAMAITSLGATGNPGRSSSRASAQWATGRLPRDHQIAAAGRPKGEDDFTGGGRRKLPALQLHAFARRAGDPTCIIRTRRGEHWIRGASSTVPAPARPHVESSSVVAQ
jgi:hypothetical protein